MNIRGVFSKVMGKVLGRDEKGCPVANMDEKPMGFEEASNKVGKMQDMSEDDWRKHYEKEEFPINDMTHENRMAYIKNALSVCDFKGKEKYEAILKIKLQMSNSSYAQFTEKQKNQLIAGYLRRYFSLNLKPLQIKILESEAIKFVMDQINATREGKKGLVPILN